MSKLAQPCEEIGFDPCGGDSNSKKSILWPPSRPALKGRLEKPVPCVFENEHSFISRY